MVRVRVLNVEPDRQRIGLALQAVLSATASAEDADSPLPPEPYEPEAGESVDAPQDASEEEDEA